MKKKVIVFAVAVVLLALSACTFQTTSSDDSMSTRVAQILTQEYTPPAAPTEAPLEQPTSEPTQEPTEATPEVIVVITPTPTLEIPAETLVVITEEPVEEATAEVTEEATEESTEQASSSPAQDPRKKLGEPDSTDPMDDKTMWNWPEGSDAFTDIDFDDGYLVLTANQDVAGWRLPMVPALTDMYVEMTVRTGKCQTDDSYGIFFHIPSFNRPDQGYLFTISCDGRYRLTRWDGRAGANGQGWRLVDWTASDYIKPGTDEENRIGVMSYDGQFFLYANGYLLNADPLKDTDRPFSTGHIGVFAAARQTDDFTIYIDEMSYWDTAFKP